MSPGPEPKAVTLDRIQRRAIEAQALAPLMRALVRKLGRKEALELLREVNEQEAFQRGRSSYAARGGNGIPELVEEVASWGEGGVLEMNVIEQTDSTFFFDVTRCPYYERYKELGLEELGVAMSCCRDEPHARGFHPELRLERTQTLMEGADRCDFRYRLERTKA